MRLGWVDYAKGLGIIFVVFGHVNRGLYNANIKLSEPLYNLIDSVIYSFHMPLFFFLSGLFFTQSIDSRGKKDFILSKIDTIVYPYIIWSFLQGSIEVLLSKYTNTAASFGSLLMLFSQPRAQFWYLYALFMMFALAAALYSKKTFEKSLPFILLASAVLYTFLASEEIAFNLTYLAQFFVFFIAGSLAVKHAELIAKGGFKTTAALLLLFLSLQWLFHQKFHLLYTDTGVFSLVLAFVGIAFIVNISLQLNKLDICWIKYLGETCMVIYLMHILAASGVRILSMRILHIENWYVQAFLGTSMGILIPIIGYLVITKLKLTFLFVPPRQMLLTEQFKKKQIKT